MDKIEVEYYDLCEHFDLTLSKLKKPLELQRMKKCGYLWKADKHVELITELDTEDEGNTDIIVIPKDLIISLKVIK